MKNIDNSQIYSLYFDGRMDTILSERENIIKEEHITLLKEPGSIYLVHVVTNVSDDVIISSENVIISMISDTNIEIRRK